MLRRLGEQSAHIGEGESGAPADLMSARGRLLQASGPQSWRIFAEPRSAALSAQRLPSRWEPRLRGDVRVGWQPLLSL